MASEFNYIRTLLILQIIHIYGSIHQNVFITAADFTNNSNVYDPSVTSDTATTIDSSKLNITVIDQFGSDLQISLGSSFGFDPLFSSSIHLIINGSIPIFHESENILFVFSDSNNKYFYTNANLYRTYPFQIYPSTNHQLPIHNTHHIINTSIRHKNKRYITNNSWFNISLQNRVTFPMYITITNNPITNSVIYQYKDANNINCITVHYNSSFTPNSGFNINIGGDNLNTTFIISSLNISYYINDIFQTTSYPKTSELITTIVNNLSETTTNLEQTTLKQYPSHNDLIMGLHGYIGYLIISAIFLCSIMCFISGICIGMIYYKRKINSYNKENKSDIDKQPEELKKQLSSNDQFADRFSITCNYDDAETEQMMMALSINNHMDETEESHESLYIDDKNNDEKINLTPQTSGNVINNNNHKNEQELKIEINDKTSGTNGEEYMFKKQQTVSTNTTIVDNYQYNTLRIEYNVTGNDIYPDEGIVLRI